MGKEKNHQGGPLRKSDTCKNFTINQKQSQGGPHRHLTLVKIYRKKFSPRAAISEVEDHADHRYHRDHRRNKALKRFFPRAAISKVGDHADHRTTEITAEVR